jgi:hypothetical protein
MSYKLTHRIFHRRNRLKCLIVPLLMALVAVKVAKMGRNVSATGAENFVPRFDDAVFHWVAYPSLRMASFYAQ